MSSVPPLTGSTGDEVATSLFDNVVDDFDFNNIIWQDTSNLDPHSFDWLSTGSPQVATFNHNTHYAPAPASPTASVTQKGHPLVERFLSSGVPPILASVEVGPRWTSAKMLFASLSNSSSMVRHAVMSFAALENSRQYGAPSEEHSALRDKAAMELSTFAVTARKDPDSVKADLQYALATVFFLAYSDLLTNRVSDAHTSLSEGACLVKIYKGKELTSVERRLVSWIRLVDARASSAGSDGAFLTETESQVYSPESNSKTSPGTTELVAGTGQSLDSLIEETLFDILYTPGLNFYQRVQSIMARVSNIDPWHRSRGTVSDETEVMAIASNISHDLESLGAQRPALMDYAVAGALNEKHLAKEIADSITRSYRTYWANHQAGSIHLHRVAYKHLPATTDVTNAQGTIKNIARLFEASSESLPVNFIWPLLMACCEEGNLVDRAWMIQSIRGMQSVVSNAKPIADVLEEVHRRQDASKQRADVRQTSMDLFNMSFAVV